MSGFAKVRLKLGEGTYHVPSLNLSFYDNEEIEMPSDLAKKVVAMSKGKLVISSSTSIQTPKKTKKK